ncbi:MAG: transposase [Rhizobiaceae bacterium]
MSKRPRYTQEFKEQAIKLSLMPEMTIDQVAAELGISAGTLVGWRQKAGVSASRNGVGHSLRKELESLRCRIQELEKEKKAVEMERDIIKKAAVFFAKNL